MGLMHVGGVFVVLLMGMSLACLVAFFEHYVEKRKRQRQPISVIFIVMNRETAVISVYILTKKYKLTLFHCF